MAKEKLTKDEMRIELRKFADSLIEGYEDDTTVIELLYNNDVIDDYLHFNYKET